MARSFQLVYIERPLWGSLVSCGPIGNRPARRLAGTPSVWVARRMASGWRILPHKSLRHATL
jgi:hypothetical protein